MRFTITPEAAIRFTKARVYLISSWPPTSSANQQQMFWFNIRWWISFIFLLTLFFPLLNGIYVFRNDTSIVIKAVCLSAATLQAIIKMMISRYQWSRLEILYTEMGNYIKNSTPFERKLIQVYVDKGAVFHLFFTSSTWLVCLALYIEPILFSQPFPTDVSYPFPVDNQIVHNALYAQQVVAIFLVASALIVDNQVAILIWFTCARFEILGQQFNEVTNEEDLKDCVKQHQHILRYAHEVKKAVRFIAVGTITTTTIGVICGLLTMLTPQPLSVKIRVAAIVGDAATELLIYSWPADNLIKVSQAIGYKVYHCDWINQSNVMKKIIQIVIHRSQKPVFISVSGFIPNLSLQYYTQFLSSTFSYFTTLRIIISKDHQE